MPKKASENPSLVADCVLEKTGSALQPRWTLTAVLQDIACPTSFAELLIRRYPSQLFDQVTGVDSHRNV
jgi:hypothetical protein